MFCISLTLWTTHPLSSMSMTLLFSLLKAKQFLTRIPWVPADRRQKAQAQSTNTNRTGRRQMSVALRVCAQPTGQPLAHEPMGATCWKVDDVDVDLPIFFSAHLRAFCLCPTHPLGLGHSPGRPSAKLQLCYQRRSNTTNTTARLLHRFLCMATACHCGCCAVCSGTER